MSAEDTEALEPIRKMSSLKGRASARFPPPESVLVDPHTEDEDSSRTGTAEDHDSDMELQESPEKVNGLSDDQNATNLDDDGPVWHAKIMTDGFGSIKSKRPMPTIKVSELYEGLERKGGRWIFVKELNGWPGLINLELKSLTTASKGLLGHKSVKRLWKRGLAEEAPDLPPKESIPKRTRATFVAPKWASNGFSADSPGFAWWYSMHGGSQPKLIWGEKMLEELTFGEDGHSCATIVHAFAHRYPVAKETFKDQQTWHAGILIEWSHGKFTTLVELAYLFGCSGYNGRANWIEDKLEPQTSLDKSTPNSFKCPWSEELSEIRMYDMPFRDGDGLRSWLQKYSKEGGCESEEVRFVDPKIYATGNVRLRSVSPSQLAGYILNYIARAWKYIELTPAGASNCQTFAADLFSFLTGNKDAKPYGKVVRSAYKQRSFSFLYRPNR